MVLALLGIIQKGRDGHGDWGAQLCKDNMQQMCLSMLKLLGLKSGSYREEEEKEANQNHTWGLFQIISTLRLIKLQIPGRITMELSLLPLYSYTILGGKSRLLL